MQIKELIEKIHFLTTLRNKNVIAIDGRCCSGKTTLSLKLKQLFNCSIIHMDDFFLPIHLQKKRDPLEIAGNIDKKRFIDEIVNPLQVDQEIIYYKYNCILNEFTEKVQVTTDKLIIIEGVYTMYPRFRSIYDFTLVMDVNKETQLKRLIKREGKDKAKIFLEKWIPKEERYFKSHSIYLSSHFYLNTSNWKG